MSTKNTICISSSGLARTKTGVRFDDYFKFKNIN